MEIPSVSNQDDAKSREASYSHILEHMINPSNELLDSLRLQLPHFLCDSAVSCQRIALNICDQFFRFSNDINYAEYADILIHNCFISNPEQSTPLIEQCYKADYYGVAPLLYENLTNRPPDQLKNILAIVISYLATLTINTADQSAAMNEIDDIIKHITPLTKNKSDEIKKETIAAIDSANIVSQSFQNRNKVKNETVESPPVDTTTKSNYYADEPDENGQKVSKWSILVHSENWKERKEGYGILLDTIKGNKIQITINEIDHDFLIAATSEKHIACLNTVLEIIETIAKVYKTQMMRKLREYLQVIINIMGQRKNPRLTYLQSSFDYIASNVTSSPYEAPFEEYLVKMMTSTNLRLKEESLQFIQRYGKNYNDSVVINEALTKLTSDPNQSIREIASQLISVNSPLTNGTANIPKTDSNANISTVARPTSSKSPDSLKRTVRKKQLIQNTWNSWVVPDTLQLLSSGQWQSVTKGLENLRKQYDGDKSCRCAVVAGLTTLFTGRTFTPKVMTILFQHIIFYLQDKSESCDKLNEEAITSTVTFCIDKIVDKHFEGNIFEILTACCESTSSSFVYEMIFPHFNSKNPVVVSRLVSFLAYHIEQTSNESNSSLYIEVSNQIQPLLSHGDANVRKASSDCYESLSRAAPNLNLNLPQPNSPSPINSANSNPLNFTFNKKSSTNNNNNNTGMKSVKNRDLANTFNPSSANKNLDDSQPLIPSKLVVAVGKTSNFVECKKGLDDLESLLTELNQQREPNSLPCSEFVDLFNRLRPWFKDANTNFVLSVSKVILLSLKLISELNDSISNDYLSDLVLLLNFVNKGIRSTTFKILDEINQMKDDFVYSVFVPTFGRLNVEGRKAGIQFIRDLDFGMDVDDVFSPFIVNILSDKNEEFRNSSLPLMIKYFSLDGSRERIMKEVDQFPPAKKNMIISNMSQFESKIGTKPENNRPFTAKKPDTDPGELSPRNKKLSLSMKPSTNNNGGTTRIPVKKADNDNSNTKIPVRKQNDDSSPIRNRKKFEEKNSNSSIPILKKETDENTQKQIALSRTISSTDELTQSITKPPIIDSTGCCRLNDSLTQKISDPSIYVYQWIADLNSSDLNRINLSTKAIMKHLKSNTGIFLIHVEALSASLVCKFHSFLMATPFPEQSIKSLTLCLFHLFQDQKLSKKVPKEFIDQIVIEICVHYQIADEKNLSSDFSCLIEQMIESTPIYTFSSLLMVIGEFDFKHLTNTLRFFNNCCEKILMIGNTSNYVYKALLMIDQFFIVHRKDKILNCPNQYKSLSQNVIKSLEDFIKRSGELYPDIVELTSNRNKFALDSPVLPLLEVSKRKKGQPTIPSPTGSQTNGTGSQLRTSNQPVKTQQSVQQKVRITMPNT